MKRTHLVRCGCALLAAWLVAACKLPGAADPPPTELRIGLLTTLSGTAADVVGKSTLEGAQLAVKRANDAGGVSVGGHKEHVVLLVQDDQDQVEAAIDGARKLITQQGVAAIVGPQFSRNAIPVAGVAEDAHVPMISPASTRPRDDSQQALCLSRGVHRSVSGAGAGSVRPRRAACSDRRRRLRRRQRLQQGAGRNLSRCV